MQPVLGLPVSASLVASLDRKIHLFSCDERTRPLRLRFCRNVVHEGVIVVWVVVKDR